MQCKTCFGGRTCSFNPYFVDALFLLRALLVDTPFCWDFYLLIWFPLIFCPPSRILEICFDPEYSATTTRDDTSMLSLSLLT